MVDCPKTKNPACLSGEQGSRKSVICWIVNYLPASLVWSSFAELGCVTPNPNPGLPIRRNIPAQRNHAVACECLEYVLNEFIGDEGVA
jgi:hypothetical protein